MKILLLTFFLMTLVLPAHAAKKKLICSRADIDKAIKVATSHSQNDKNRHCSVSCLLTLKCNSNYVLGLGIAKEIKDATGKGNAEWADFEADRMGIALVLSKRALSNRECLSQCDLYYQ